MTVVFGGLTVVFGVGFVVWPDHKNHGQTTKKTTVKQQKTTVKPQKTRSLFFHGLTVFFFEFDLPCFSCSLDVTISAWVWCVVWYVWVCVVGEGGVAVLCVVSCRVVSCRVVSCRVVSCRVVSCRVVSCRVVSCRVVSCRVVSPCVPAPRPQVSYMWTWCRYTRRRVECTRRGVLDGHTWRRAVIASSAYQNLPT